MSKALAGVARTRIKAIKVQRERLAKRDWALAEEQMELQKIVDAYSTDDAPEDMSSIEVEEV